MKSIGDVMGLAGDLGGASVLRNGIGRVLVVGGGVGGMTAALSLRAKGVDVDLVDIDPDWRAAGAGLTLNGATLRAFEVLGVLDEVRAAGHIHGGRRIYSRAGDLLFDMPAYCPDRDDLNAGGGILRPALHGILSQRTLAAGVAVRLGVTVERLDMAGLSVAVGFNDGGNRDYDLVIGADGIMSHLRRLVMPAAAAPAFTGQGCWRAVFARPADVKTSRLYIDSTHKLGLNPVSDAEMYMFLLEAAPGNPWRAQEEWVDLLAARLRAFAGLPHDLADQLSDRSLVNYRPLETLLLPAPWHVGRVVLLGDAAHATTPHAGYGAGLAIEDGVVLAKLLARADEVEAALVAYAAARFERCAGVLQASLALGKMELEAAPIEAQLGASAALFAMTREPFL